MEAIQSILDNLTKDTPEIRGAVVTTLEGFPIASAKRVNMDTELVSAVIASLAALMKRSTETLDLGQPNEVMINADVGRIFVYRVGDVAALGVVTAQNITTGLLILKIRNALKQLEVVLQEVLGGGF